MVNYEVQKSKVTCFLGQRVYYSTFAAAATLSRPSSSSLTLANPTRLACSLGLSATSQRYFSLRTN
jgi:hypothetical protein